MDAPAGQDEVVRILLWHGYLLGGTGSNVYTRQLAREWSRAGHEVIVLCQEPHPERYDVGGATVVRPDVGGLLPVFVLDRYEGYQVELLQDLTETRSPAGSRRTPPPSASSCLPISSSATTSSSVGRWAGLPGRRTS